MHRQRYLMIAVTGLVAMIAQTVWYRYASQALGQSSLTVAAVVATALSGLAIGNEWGGKFAKASAGWFVVGLGISVLLSQAFFHSLPSLEPLLSGTPAIWTIVVVSPLLVINFFAGVVFPVLLRRENDSPVVGRLSATETLGGCVGAILTSCFAMQNFGLAATLVGGGLLAMALGTIGLRVGNQSHTDTNTDTDTDRVVKNTSVSVRMAIIIAVCVSGVASLGMEIVWQRLLILIVGTDSYSYAIVVTSYLLGVSTGAAVSALWLRRRPAVPQKTRLQTVAVLQVLVAISSLIILTAVIYLASGTGQAWTNGSLFGYDAPLLKRLLLCGGLLMIPTAIQGALFPLVVDAVADKRSDLASPVGKIYALLAIGNVVGVLICGFFMVPQLGLQQSVIILAIVSTIAAWLFATKKFSATMIALTVALIVLCGHRLLNSDVIGLAINPEQTDLLYYREGAAHTVAVLAEKANPDYRRMTVDGIVIGQSGKNAEEKQLMLAHLPALLNYKRHPLKHVAVVGLGSGLLSGEVATIDGVRTVNTVELSPTVIEASQHFADLLPANPAARTNVIQADGIHWMIKGDKNPQPLDAIISDGKSRPGHVGNAAFFSSDYYLASAKRLSPHGKFVQWYSLDAAVTETRIVLRTFAASFPHAVVAFAAPDSIYLVGSRQPIEMEAKDADAYLQLETSRSLNIYHWCSADDLRSMGWIGLMPENTLLTTATTNSLDRPILEQFSFDVRAQTLTDNKIENLELLKSIVDSHQSSAGLFVDAGTSKLRSASAVTRMLDAFIVVLKREQGWLDEAASQMMPVLETLPKLHRGALLANSYLVAAELAAGQNDKPGEVSMLDRAGALSPADFSMQMKIGQRLLTLDKADSALPRFLNAIASQPESGPANKGAAIALIKMQKLKTAFRYFQKAIADPAIRLDAEFIKLEGHFHLSAFPPSLDESKPGQGLIESMKSLLEEKESLTDDFSP